MTMPLEPIPQKRIAQVAGAIAVATAGIVVALWWAGTAGLSGPGLVTARLDALRTGLSIGIGGGGVFALYLAWRRQHSTEVGVQQKEHEQNLDREIADDNRKDAAARRITELYAKACEQLGSDKAPVRLGGLYALGRLGQDNAALRQTVADMLCAYLRMPYTPPESEPPGDRAEALKAHRDAVQEREVRLTAQRILVSHLRAEAFWPDIDLDLTNAMLIAFDMSRCRLRGAGFEGATFLRYSTFEGTEFDGLADFTSATFDSAADFERTFFHAWASFLDTSFNGPIALNKAFVAHDMAELSMWPKGWRLSDEHTPIGLRDGTWHRLIRKEDTTEAAPVA